MSVAINRLVSGRIRALRIDGGARGRPLTQSEFAQLTGVNKSTIVNIENGRQGATLPVLYQIASSLALPIPDLLPSVPDVLNLRAQDEPDVRYEEGLDEWAEVVMKLTSELG